MNDSTILIQEDKPTSRLILAIVPLIFILVWSSGFVAAKFGLSYAPPLTFLTLRFICVLAVLVPLVLIIKAPWPKGQVRHITISGTMLQAGYLTTLWCAIKMGMPAGLSALIVGMQPILTAFSAPLIGESVKKKQWIGLVLGICGVALVVFNKISLIGLSWESIVLCLVALFSITAGTLYQKHHCPNFDLRTGAIIQFFASLVITLPLAIVFEGLSLHLETIEWNVRFLGALLWSVFALSIGAIFLWFTLIRKTSTTRVTSLLYLTPPTTAIMAWLMFGESFSIFEMLGMVLAVIGVIFVVSN